MSERVTMVDPRQPRLGQGITGAALAMGYLADVPAVIPVIAALLAAASLLGPRGNPYAYLFRALKRVLSLGPPRELEEAAPPRFANTLGFVFLTAASVAYFAFSPPLLSGWAAWGLTLLVSALALLSAATGLCVGCELYVAARRFVTRGRIPGRRVTTPAASAEGRA